MVAMVVIENYSIKTGFNSIINNSAQEISYEILMNAVTYILFEILLFIPLEYFGLTNFHENHRKKNFCLQLAEYFARQLYTPPTRHTTLLEVTKVWPLGKHRYANS